MDFECCFNLLRCHLLACTVFSIDPDALFRLRLQQVTLAILPSVRLSTGSDPGLSPLIRKAGLLGQRRKLFEQARLSPFWRKFGTCWHIFL